MNKKTLFDDIEAYERDAKYQLDPSGEITNRAKDLVAFVFDSLTRGERDQCARALGGEAFDHFMVNNAHIMLKTEISKAKERGKS